MARTLLSLIWLLIIGIAPVVSCAETDTVGGDFKLKTHLNQPYSSSEAKGKVVLLFFGFTHCPDVCPNTLSTIQTVLSQLGDQAKDVQTLFITVDPKRDTPEILSSYLKYFDNNFIGLTGSSDEIDDVVKQFRGFYSYIGDVANGQYTVDHTSNLYIIDINGEVTNIIPHGLPPKAITPVIEKLLDEIKA
ncbi:MAG: SCO family protein [Pseudomonadota bacterium]